MQLLLLPPMERGAIISSCGLYRYGLWRVWDRSKPKAMFMMLNPSTADADNDDPTIRRCIAFAKSWGYGSIYVCNLFAFRSTDPKGLISCNDPIGDDNIIHLRILALNVEIIVCAWGNSSIVDRLLSKREWYRPFENIKGDKLRYLALSNDGTPKHPLYLKGDLTPQKLIIKRRY